MSLMWRFCGFQSIDKGYEFMLPKPSRDIGLFENNVETLLLEINSKSSHWSLLVLGKETSLHNFSSFAGVCEALQSPVPAKIHKRVTGRDARHSRIFET